MNTRDREQGGRRSLRERVPLRTLFVEVVSIVLGVLLALGVNEWRELRQADRQAETALTHVRAEIGSNWRMLDYIHANNARTLELMGQEDTLGHDEERSFIPALQLKETAWQTLLTTGTSAHLDYETVIQLSDTYSILSVYKQAGTILTEAAMNMAGLAAVDGKEVSDEHFQSQFRNFFTNMVQAEEALLTSLRESDMFLDSLGIARPDTLRRPGS